MAIRSISITTHHAKGLPCLDRRTREFPVSLLGLDKKIEGSLQSPVQAPLVILLVRLRHSGEGSGNLLLLARILRSGIGSTLCIPHKHLNLMLWFGLNGSHEQFVIPCFLRVRVIFADVACRRLTLPNLTLPVLVSWSTSLEIEIFCKWECQSLVQPFLVKKVRLFEWCEITGDLRRTR